MTLKVLQVGAGGWGERWCQDFLPRATRLGMLEVAGLMDVDPAALKRGQKQLGLEDSACFTDPKEAFRKTKADFCTIVVPPAHHEIFIDLAVAHNTHILSEKPIADTMEASARIVSKVSAAGLKMAVTMSRRFDQDKQTLTEVVRSGQLGTLNTLHCRLSADYRLKDAWRRFRHLMKHPLLIEGAVHQLDILDSLAGARCKTVFARTWRPAWAEYAGDTDGTVVMSYENDVHATFEGSKSSPVGVSDWQHEQIRVEGKDAIAILNHRELEVFHRVYNLVPREFAGFQIGQRARQGDGMKFQSLSGDAWEHDLLLEHYVRWLEGGPQMETHAAANVLSLAIVFAAIESVETGAEINMRDFCARFGLN
jgi:predicted dehydrogenase